MKKNMLLFSFMFLVIPASTNYSLKSFDLNSGGDDSLTSTSYALEGATGEQGSDPMNSTTYKNLPGLLYTQMVNTPQAPTVANDSDYTNKLLVTLDSASNPTDTTFAIAISDDNFVTTQYIQSDNTFGSSLGSEDWQTYANWGSGSGEFVVGLAPNTTYYFKAKAVQGDFTEGPWGPVSSVATSALSISFDIDVSATDTESAAPYTVALGDLASGSIITSTEKIWIDLSTNAPGGGFVYVFGSNGGLYSTKTNHTISAVSGNLSSLDEGFGIQYDSLAQSSGGPFAVTSPYDGAGEVVGTIQTDPQEIFNTSSQPITAGRASFVTKAKIDDLTPAATDYTDTLTIISAASF
jgi:hypothetical protein